MPMPIPAQQQASAPITAESLAAMGTPEAQKQFLGEHLYPRVAAVDQAQAGRVVGMILEAYN